MLPGQASHPLISALPLQLKEALATGVKLAVNQLAYNLIFRAAEMEIMPFCARHGIGVLAYSPLMQGLLTDAPWTRTADSVPTYRARTRKSCTQTHAKKPCTRARIRGSSWPLGY